VSKLGHLFSQNVEWAETIRQQDPDFFKKLSSQQAPQYLWIGCSDSRVPANEIVGLLPGELFVHRNVANVVVHSDLNCLSVIQFAVDVLKVKHVIVTGHYGCSGVAAALQNQKLGLIDNWLRHVQDVRQMHGLILDELEGEKAKVDMLCELNVIEQAVNVSQTTIVQDAWARGQELTIHGWIYGVHDGRIRDLNMAVEQPTELGETYSKALDACLARKGVQLRARKPPR
jgi:carbonic anhydrase